MIADVITAAVLAVLVWAVIGLGPVAFGEWQDRRLREGWERGREEDRRYWDAQERARRGQP